MTDFISQTSVHQHGWSHGTDRQGELYHYIDEIVKSPAKAESHYRDLVEQIQSNGLDEKVMVRTANDQRKGETVLHYAIKLFKFEHEVERKVVKLLIETYPKLIQHARAESVEYAGQTPLHLAVCKGNIWLVDLLLRHMAKAPLKGAKSALFKQRAHGTNFHNTVMMAQLPLSIAALTFNKGMFDLLLREGAELDGTNSHKDNVCHSLIRYAFLYPDKLEDVLSMCRYITDDPTPFEQSAKAAKTRKLRKKIWVMENEDCYNPLQLSAKFGQHDIFRFIMNHEAYCFENIKDGLFDIKIYDVTELDAISHMKKDDITGINQAMRQSMVPENISERRAFTKESNSFRKSIMMMLLELEPASAFQFILFPPLQRIVDRKWAVYRKFFYPWWLIYFMFMCFLTWYGIERSLQSANTPSGFDTSLAANFTKTIPSDPFVTTFSVISMIVAVLFLFQEVVRMFKRRMPWTIKSFLNPYSNGTFRVMFIIFSISLIIDLPVAICAQYYENYCLMVALLTGWFNLIFFLRDLRPFSFFTVLIQKVLLGDMFRFFVIISIELMAFGSVMYMALQGSEVETSEDFGNFGRALFSMLKLMVGLGEIDPIYRTRHPSLVIIIFIAFIVMTTLLMINALIAMVSRTCTELVENINGINARDMHWKLQRLSVILFLDSVLPQRAIVKIGKEQELYRYNNELGRRKAMKRYLLEKRSILQESEPINEEVQSSWGLRTALFNGISNRHGGHKERPLSGLSEKLRKFFERNNQNDKDVSEEPIEGRVNPAFHRGLKQDHSPVGLNRDPMPLNRDHVDLNHDHMGLNREAMGLNRDHVDMNREAMILNRDHVDMNLDNMDINRDHIMALNREAMTLNRDHVDMTRDHVGLNRDHESVNHAPTSSVPTGNNQYLGMEILEIHHACNNVHCPDCNDMH